MRIPLGSDRIVYHEHCGEINLVKMVQTLFTSTKILITSLLSKVDSTLLPRDAMHKRGLCLRAVSDWVSVTFAYCVETAKVMAIVATECE